MEKNKKSYYDLHSHILPGMDDGSESPEESAEMLKESLWQGVIGMAATSHYYPQETVENFLQRRSEAYRKLKEYLAETETPAPLILLGAEVAYHSGIIYEEDLQKLCLGKSNYLLLELPFTRWSPNVIRDVKSMYHVRGIIPIIAHLERYRDIVDKKTLKELLDGDVYIQMNAEYFLDRETRKKAKKWVKKGNVQVMGSDSHNMDNRYPNLGYALDMIQKEKLYDAYDSITDCSRDIFKAAWG